MEQLSSLFFTHFLLPNSTHTIFFSEFGTQYKGVVLHSINGYQTWDGASYDIWNVCLSIEEDESRSLIQS